MTHSQEWQVIFYLVQVTLLYFSILYTIAFVAKCCEFLVMGIRNLSVTISATRTITLALLWTAFWTLRMIPIFS